MRHEHEHDHRRRRRRHPGPPLEDRLGRPSINTGIGLADDLSTGLIERFRSLAMTRSAVLAGRTLADAVRNLIVILLMVTVGFLVGFQLHTNVLGLIGAVALMSTAGKVFASLAWSLAVVAVFAPLAVRRYRRAA